MAAKDGLVVRPWMRWSPRDFLADPAVACMTREQRWRYRDALDFSWLTQTPGSALESQWRLWMSYSEAEWVGVREVHAAAFVVTGCLWEQKRMVAEAEHSLTKSMKARRSVGKRKDRSTDDVRSYDDGGTDDVRPKYVRSTEGEVEVDLEAESTSTPLSLAGARSASLNGTAVANRNGVTKRTLPRCAAPLPPGFDAFWDAYPSKVGRKAALAAFGKAIATVELPVMLAGLERAKVSPRWTKDGGQYIPNPATWLNQGRWDDQQPTIAPAGAVADAW